MFGDVLVHLGDDAGAEARLEQAIKIAEIFGGSLTGVHVAPREDPALHAREAAFISAVSHARIPFRQLTAVGPGAAGICAHARYADLVVIGRQGGEAGEDPHPFTLAEQVARRCGRPVLVAPDGTWSFSDRRVLLAWDGSREAVRALHDALPMLRRAAKVTALVVLPEFDPDPQAVVADAELRNYLARHGVDARNFTWTQRSGLRSAAILDELREGQFDLLVMGAYGEPAWIEGLRDGVTSEVDRGRVARPFGFALTDPGMRLSRTRLFPEVTRVMPHVGSKGE